MPSLIDLDTNLLVYIAARYDLESAGYLSLVNKQVWGAVAPVLPALTDVRALRLLLPFQDNVIQGDFSLQDPSMTSQL